jgi:hypothetical protein
MVISTCHGTALALPWLFPSASLIIIAFPIVGSGRLYRVARRLGWKIALSSSVSALHMRAVKQSDSIELSCAELHREYMECFDGLGADPLIKEDVIPTLERTIYAVSNYVGCPVSITCMAGINCTADIDLPLFETFVYLFTICARNHSRTREVNFDLRKHNRGIVIAARFVTGQALSDDDISELCAMRLICERKNLRFEYVSDGNIVHAYFEPLRKEWSLLGIKCSE